MEVSLAYKSETAQPFFESHDSQKKQRHDLELLNPDQIVQAIDQAKSRLAPLWDVRDYVAVNPLFGYRDQKILTTLQRVRSLTGTVLLPEKSFFKDLYQTQEILNEDLTTSLILLQKESFLNPTQDYDHSTLLAFLDSSHIEVRREELIKSVSDLYDIENEQNKTDLITKEISKWASAYFDEGQSVWKMPGKDKRFFKAWKSLIEFDQSVDKVSPQTKKKARNLPQDPQKAIVQMIQELQTFRMDRDLPIVDYFARNLATVSGWASYIQKFEFEESLNGSSGALPLRGGVVDLLAIRLAYDLSLLEQVQDLSNLGLVERESAEVLKEMECRYIWLQALEVARRRKISRAINFSNLSLKKESRLLAQMAFCIDVRSEIIRRHLENQSENIQTIGFAGFFGLPIAVKRFGFSGRDAQCPVLIKPALEITESAHKDVDKIKQSRQEAVYSRYGLKAMQGSTNSSFSVAETFGFASAFKMLLSAAARIKPNIPLETLGFKNGKQKEIYLDLSEGHGKARVKDSENTEAIKINMISLLELVQKNKVKYKSINFIF